MFSSENLNHMLKDIMSKLSRNQKNAEAKNKLSITPSQALVIGGILGGVLDVDSVLIGKDQTVEIVLSGSLKQKTELEKMLDQVGSMPFDEVMKALMEKFT